MNTKTWVFGVLFCSASTFGFAQQETDSLKIQELDEVVVTDSKFNLKRENSGKVITTITQKELQNLQGKSVAEILSTTSGIEINGTRSNAAQNLLYLVRGGRNRQVLIMIDGVAVTDPSQIANDYDLRLLNADQVERIEILKGASSTLYGTGAATAVINITLKKASKDAVTVNLRSTLGTNQTQDDNDYAIDNHRNSVAVNGSLDDFNYMVSFGQQYTDGISAVQQDTGDDDAFNSINGYLMLGYEFSDKFKLGTFASFDKIKADFDDGFAFMDAENQSITDQFRLGISPEFSYKNGSITMNAIYNNVEREIRSSAPGMFKSESFVGDIFNRYNFNDQFYTVLGLNAQENTIETFTVPFGGTALQQAIDPDDATFTIIDPYLNVVYVTDFGLNVNVGLRLNNHSEYGSHFVYSVNPSYRKTVGFGYIKGLASYSTAYITPSLFQLFEPTFGNPDLDPEENATIEVGAEVGIKDKATISLVYFNRQEENFVDFVDIGNFVFQYDNIDEEFTASGLELVADVSITKKLKFLINGTYTNVDEDVNLRIPEIKVNTALNYQMSDRTFMSLNYQYNDEREDAYFDNVTFVTEQVTLDAFGLLDFYISHKVMDDKMTLFANVTNIFDEDYEELFGFTTLGRNINIGFSLNL
ncbi:MAG: TonB-dependent receptor [Psychroserpens sp.]|nr:TonB-dependent receptor [Psychroserpens sp.]